MAFSTRAAVNGRRMSTSSFQREFPHWNEIISAVLSEDQDISHIDLPENNKTVDKIMDKVYKEYKRQLSHGTASLTESDLENGFHVSHTAIRKDEVLSNREKQFLVSVERGDMATARTYLEVSEDDPTFNINCRDPLGRSALLIAIEYENIEMMEVLLSFNVEVRDALLHAINEENVEAVEMLLKYQQNVHKQKNLQIDSEENGLLGQSQSDSFTPDITPLMLAAHRDNYEIIKILLERGDRIPKPHNVQCPCKECIAYSNDDILCHSRSRINAYKALASPSLICLSSRDPILTAFELSWELRTLSQLEPEFKSTYRNLSKQVQDFATELLDQTRGSEELETILNHNTESPVSEDEAEVMTLSRLRLAIKYKQKEFVAHAHCQQLLASIWYEGLPGFRRQHIAYRIMMIMGIGLLAPLWAVLYILAPRSLFGNLMRKPFIKFIVHSASYCIFLFLLILTSQRISFSNGTGFGEAGQKMQNEVRGPPPTIIEGLITSWVIGLIWSEMKQLWNCGITEYIHDMWNILDFTTNTLYIATITLRVIAYTKVQEERILGLPSAHIERKNWNAYDPNLIAEALFAAANIFSALKLVYIFSINPYLGPLQISLGRMVVDITKFGTIYLLVIFSFACGLNQLFWYYSLSRSNECEANADLCSYSNSKFLRFFSDLFEIMQTLYWAMFGLVDLDAIRLQEDHSFTQFAGKVMFGVYSYISVIVLINMLIAMMNTSYQIISSQEDTEWKFARSKLWMTYFEDGGTLPAPFNVIPTPKTVIYFLLYVKNLLCRCSNKHKRNRWHSIRKIVKKINERERKYQVVMKNLIKRYIMNKSRDKIDEGVTEDDINEIKQDISSFRYELLEILRNNGMEIPDYSRKSNKLGGNSRSNNKKSKYAADVTLKLNAMKTKRKKSYMREWQKQGSAEHLFDDIHSDDSSYWGSKRNSADSAADMLSQSMNENILSAAAPNKLQRRPSTFKLERSQSDITFNSANLPNAQHSVSKLLGDGKLSTSFFKSLLQKSAAAEGSSVDSIYSSYDSLNSSRQSNTPTDDPKSTRRLSFSALFNNSKQKQVTFQNRTDGEAAGHSKRDSTKDLPTVSEESS